jgi:glycosyltransferase involved in cell wall biosynthesis
MDLSKPRGGTELLLENLQGCLAPEALSGINLILSSTDPSLLKANQINVLWNHHSYDQASIANLGNPKYLEAINHVVYVSHWQYEKFRMAFKVPGGKSTVIKNAIQSLDLLDKPPKLRLVYASTPWRGLKVLLDSFERLNRDQVELDIYSSTIIYGSEFDRQNRATFEPLFERARGMRNVNYKGYAPNAVVREALQNSHILAYPSIWQETSCLTAIEAAMAGCHVVTTNFGALPETLAEWGTYVTIDGDEAALARRYTAALQKSVDEFWDPEVQQRLRAQHHYFKRFYTWGAREGQWRDFLDSLRVNAGSVRV